MPDADTVWLTPLQEMLACLERVGLVVRWQDDCSRSHRAVADSLIDAFAADATDIAAQIGRRALEELLAAHRLWSDWLGDGRVRKIAFVAEKAATRPSRARNLSWCGSHRARRNTAVSGPKYGSFARLTLCRTMRDHAAMSWQLSGTYFENCNCNVTCPCAVSGFSVPGDNERCIVLLAFHVDSGDIDGVDVSGLSYAVVADAPGAMVEGNWRVGLLHGRGRVTGAGRGARRGRFGPARRGAGGIQPVHRRVDRHGVGRHRVPG